jgi:hypothetical protein
MFQHDSVSPETDRGSFAMKTCRFLLVCGFVAVLVGPAPAGFFFFGSHAKPNPAERVPQLLVILKTDSDENKRSNAAKELREIDPKAFPGMIRVLIDVLKHEQKAAVRVEVVQTLGKLRPISQEAGLALESAENDPSWRVRWQARQSLLGYRISGYRTPPSPGNTSPPVVPGAKQSTNAAPPVKRGLFGGTPKTGQTLVPNETPPPPLAEPATPESGPAPKGASTPVPAQRPKLQPTPTPSEAGPDLP